MQPIQPAMGQPQVSSPTAERTEPQISANTARPAAPVETARPAAAPGKSAKVDPETSSLAQPKPDASPIGMIMEAMTQSEDVGSANEPQQLVPPVPIRYLSALMLQTLSDNRETVDERS